MKPSKPINDWRKIFLDTSFILDYLSDPESHLYSEEVKSRIKLVHDLMNILDNEKHATNTSYISAITVGELYQLSKNQTTKDIIGIFNAANIAFVDYTKDTALLLNASMRSTFTSDQLRQWKNELNDNFKLTQPKYLSARRWISDDMKIVATAKSVRGIDVVLTSDCNTFKKIADRFAVPCLSMKKEEFPYDMFGSIEPATAF